MVQVDDGDEPEVGDAMLWMGFAILMDRDFWAELHLAKAWCWNDDKMRRGARRLLLQVAERSGELRTTVMVVAEGRGWRASCGGRGGDVGNFLIPWGGRREQIVWPGLLQSNGC